MNLLPPTSPIRCLSRWPHHGWVFALLLLSLPAWADVGKIDRVTGLVSVVSPDGGERALTVGASVEERDVLKSGLDGEAIVRFTDGALLVLRPNTQIAVSTYRYQANNGTNQSLIRLVRGSMRFITGLIGKSHRENARFEMPTATVGIRGTDFDAVYRDTRSNGVDAGSYSCVNEGATTMTDAQGRVVELLVGQTGFITSSELIAKGLATADRFGVIPTPKDLFKAGTFDGLLDALKLEALQPLTGAVKEKVPNVLGQLVPTLGGGNHQPKAPTQKSPTSSCSG